MLAHIGKAFAWLGKVFVSVSPWLFGLAALCIPFVLMETVAGPSIEAWSSVYVAGAVGGLVLELVRGRWRLELPSRRGIGRDPEELFAPHGPQSDIGFLGRMTTGAVAAPAFLAIVNALDVSGATNMTTHLTEIAIRPDTVAWGVLIGAVSPVVWNLAEQLVKSRLAVANTRLEINNAAAKQVLDGLKTRERNAKAKVEEHAVVSGVQLGRLATGDVVVEELPSVSAMGNVLAEYDAGVKEAIGALEVITSIKPNGTSSDS